MSEDLWSSVDSYLTRKLLPPDEILESVLRDSTDAGLPAINVTPTQGRFLNLLARIQGAKHVLEIGTLGGYSTLWLARALPPEGSLVTIERDPQCASLARRNFERAGLSTLIDVREGSALQVLPQLKSEHRPPFDFVFLDADKEHHPDYFEWALELSRPGTVIIADNVVRGGALLDSDTDDSNLRGIRRLFDLIETSPRVEASALQTVGSKGYDGFAIAVVIA